jgi:DNA-binding response OmpR family regulator
LVNKFIFATSIEKRMKNVNLEGVQILLVMDNLQEAEEIINDFQKGKAANEHVHISSIAEVRLLLESRDVADKLIIIDRFVGGEDALDYEERFRKNSSTASIPFVILNDRDEKLPGLSRPGTAILEKPFQFEKLLQSLSTVGLHLMIVRDARRSQEDHNSKR